MVVRHFLLLYLGFHVYSVLVFLLVVLVVFLLLTLHVLFAARFLKCGIPLLTFVASWYPVVFLVECMYSYVVTVLRYLMCCCCLVVLFPVVFLHFMLVDYHILFSSVFQMCRYAFEGVL